MKNKSLFILINDNGVVSLIIKLIKSNPIPSICDEILLVKNGQFGENLVVHSEEK